jgi:hypothetical protein
LWAAALLKQDEGHAEGQKDDANDLYMGNEEIDHTRFASIMPDVLSSGPHRYLAHRGVNATFCSIFAGFLLQPAGRLFHLLENLISGDFGASPRNCVLALVKRVNSGDGPPRRRAFEQQFSDHQPVIGKSRNQILAAVLCR